MTNENVALRPKEPKLPLLASAGWIRDYIGVERQWLNILVREGKVHATKIGAKLKAYRVPDVLAVVNAHQEWRRENGLDEDVAWIEEQLKKEYRE